MKFMLIYFKSDGIIKASELSNNDATKKLDEIIEIGDEIEVFVIRVDDEKVVLRYQRQKLILSKDGIG